MMNYIIYKLFMRVVEGTRIIGGELIFNQNIIRSSLFKAIKYDPNFPSAGLQDTRALFLSSLACKLNNNQINCFSFTLSFSFFIQDFISLELPILEKNISLIFLFPSVIKTHH